MKLYKGAALIIIVGLSLYALLLYSRPTEVSKVPYEKEISVATPEPNAQTKLYFSPPFLKLSPESVNELSVMVNTEENSISQAQLEISYDPKVITITSVRAGDFLRDAHLLVNKIDAKRGRIELALGLPENLQAVKGTGRLAIVTFIPGPEATLSGSTRLSFLPKSSVRGAKGNTSLLSQTESLMIEPITPLPPGL